MFDGHNPYLVALSVVAAILGGYTGFGLAARIRATPGSGRRSLLAGAAGFLAVGIWTMHFIAMLAAPIPPDAAYLVLPTIVSFLICALVVGGSLFLVSVVEPSNFRVAASALLLGAGIVSMHYVGIHALVGSFKIEHEHAMVALSIIIAVGTAYGGLRIFLARQGGMRLLFSAMAFGLAVSGMHYTAMYGMHFGPAHGASHTMGGFLASSQVLALVLALLFFLLTAGFLLSLVPEPRRRTIPAGASVAFSIGDIDTALGDDPSDEIMPLAAAPIVEGPARPEGPGQPRMATPTRLPVEGADGTHFIELGEIRSVRADAHYTLVHDGTRERMCPWSISQAEARLDPAVFVRVHRSHIVSIPHVTLMRKEGDGAVIELDSAVPHFVPVSRAKVAELKAKLGLVKRTAAPSNA